MVQVVPGIGFRSAVSRSAALVPTASRQGASDSSAAGILRHDGPGRQCQHPTGSRGNEEHERATWAVRRPRTFRIRHDIMPPHTAGPFAVTSRPGPPGASDPPEVN